MVYVLVDFQFLMFTYQMAIQQKSPKNMNLSYTTYYSDLIVYGQTSLRTPYSLYSYNLNTKETKLLRQKEVPNYDKSLYETKRIN